MKSSSDRIISDRLKDGFISSLDPLVKLATRLHIHPNTFTTVSLLLSCAAAYAMATGSLRLSAVLFLLSGLCDAIDGKLARYTGKETRFGALYDSSLDRYSEVVFFLGMALYFIRSGYYLTSGAIAAGLGGSMMVSYVKARAEGLGFKCNVGILQRAERILILGIGAFIHLYALVIGILIVAILSNITAVQRIIHVWRADREEGTQ